MEIKTTPKISVLIFSYNFASYIGECIDSVLAQSLKPFEIIICDDHSIDDSWEVIQDYYRQYPYLLRPFRQENNLGPARNGIFGQEKIRGDLYAWMDGDDRWLPRKLELEWRALQTHPSARISYSNVYVIDAKANRIGIWHSDKKSLPPSGNVFVEVFAKRFFQNTSNLFRNQLVFRSALKEVGYFDLNLENYWDWDEKIRLTAKFPVAYSGEALVEYRQNDRGFHMQDPKKQFKTMQKIYVKHSPKLEALSKKDEVKVRCNIESFLAQYKFRYSLTDNTYYYFASNTYNRNFMRLLGLTNQDRKELKAHLSEPFLSMALLALREQIGCANIKYALKYFFELFRYRLWCLNFKMLARIVFPDSFSKSLKTMFVRFLA